jgi:hypothetical protein
MGRVLDFDRVMVMSGLHHFTSEIENLKIPLRTSLNLSPKESNRMCGWKGFSNSRSLCCVESQK